MAFPTLNLKYSNITVTMLIEQSIGHLPWFSYVYMYCHFSLLVCRTSKSARQLQPLHSDTDDSLSTTHMRSRVDLKEDLSSFDRASKKFLEEMKETFLRLEREAKVRMGNCTHTHMHAHTHTHTHTRTYTHTHTHTHTHLIVMTLVI